MNVEFCSIFEVDEALPQFAVIASRYKDKWIFCKHKKRNTWEIPGGRREMNETILETAHRELYEETGATKYKITAICAYNVVKDTNKYTDSYGILYYADITELGLLPESEIEKIEFFDEIPDNLTYPDIQPFLHEKINLWLQPIKISLSEVNLRKPSIYYKKDLLELYNAVGWINYTQNPDLLRKAYINSLYWLEARLKDKIIGMIRVVGDGHSVILIQDLLVLPQYQNQGVGSLLLHEVLKEYKDVYQILIMTDNQPKSIQFYEKHGFKQMAQMGCAGLVQFKK